jgi:O-antigen/teichoic acid export membrane protein
LKATNPQDGAGQVVPLVTEPARTVARNAFFLVLGQATTTVLAIALNAVLGRRLGAEGFGVYYLLTTIATFAYVFVEWGQPLFVIRCIATAPARSGELLGSALALRIAFALVAVVPAAFAAWALGSGSHTIWLGALLMVASIPTFLIQAYGMVFRGRDRMGGDASVSSTNKALALGLTLLALALGMGLPGVIVAQGLAGLAALGLAVVIYRRLGAPRLTCNRATIREIVAGGAPILAMTAAISAQPYLDAVVLSRLAPALVVGWYGAARNILGTLIAPAAILGSAAYPQLSRVSQDQAALRETAGSAMRTMVWLGGLGATGTFLFAHEAVALIYGSSGFEPAAIILQVFAPGLFLLFVDMLIASIVYACGGAKGFAVAKIASVLVSTALDVALVPYFQTRFGNGGIAIVVSFAASEFVVFAGALLVLKRGTLSPTVLLDLGRALASAALTALVIRMLPRLPFAVGVVACVAAFTGLSILVGLVRRGDVALLRSFLRRPRLGG